MIFFRKLSQASKRFEIDYIYRVFKVYKSNTEPVYTTLVTVVSCVLERRNAF